MKELERLKKEMQADDQDLVLNGGNDDEAIYTNDQPLTRDSSSINLVAEAPPSALPLISPLLPRSLNHSVEVSDGEEEGLDATQPSGPPSRTKTRKQTSHFLVSDCETEIMPLKASNECDIHFVSCAETPISQAMSIRDKRRANGQKK